MRKGLSPLVATIILIAFTVLGGVLVYEFFVKTSESMMTSGEKLIVLASKSYFDSTRMLVQVDIVNGYRTDVSITGFKYVTPTTTVASVTQVVSGNSTINLAPGAKHTVVFIIPSDAKAIVIEYKVRGQSLVETINIS